MSNLHYKREKHYLMTIENRAEFLDVCRHASTVYILLTVHSARQQSLGRLH